MTAQLTADDRLWPVTPGQPYTQPVDHRGIHRLYIDGYRGRALITPNAVGHLITIEDGDGGVGYTQFAGPLSVIISVAETMLTAAANAAGIEVIR
jgi:hypothetical protein